MRKFDNLPTINYINLYSSEHRKQFMEEQFALHGLTNYNHYCIKPYSEYKDDISVKGKFIYQVVHVGTIVSFIRCIKDWYYNTDEAYGIFLEDDTSFETSEHWTFTFSEFVNALPSTWECVQLIRVNDWRTYADQAKLNCRGRYWDDWGATCMMTRGYAKKILDAYLVGNEEYNLEVRGGDIMPIVENLLFVGLGSVFNAPLFVEYDPVASTYSRDLSIQEAIHGKSREIYKSLWETNGLTTSLSDFVKEVV